LSFVGQGVIQSEILNTMTSYSQLSARGITVYLKDDQVVVRNAISRLLRTFERIGEVKEAESNHHLLTLCKDQIPDIVIHDYCQNEDFYVIRHLIRAHHIKVIILTMNDHIQYTSQIIGCGVRGYLLKKCSAEELEKAVHSVYDSEFYYNEYLSGDVRSLQWPAPRGLTSHQRKELSKREKEIIKLYCHQKKATEIANSLAISVKTVHTHKRNIMQKIGVKNSIGLVQYAIKAGWIVAN